VQFDHTKSEKLNGQKIDEKICPSCKKTLTNGTKIVILRHCGHVLCKVCSDDFVKPGKKCAICDEKCKEKDIIEVSTEGTGFAGGGGKVEVKKAGEAFQ
jgi:nitric oxide synthase-interacting protein